MSHKHNPFFSSNEDEEKNPYSVWAWADRRKQAKAKYALDEDDLELELRGKEKRLSQPVKKKILHGILFLVFLHIGLLLAQTLFLGNQFYKQRISFSLPGLIKGLAQQNIFVLIIVAIIAFLLAGFTSARIVGTKGRQFDERGIELDDTNSTGSSRLMTDEEKRLTYKYLDYLRPEGIILAKDKKTGEVMTLPWEERDNGYDPANRNIALFGPPGMRKTSGVLMPNIFSNLAKGNSLVCTDPKGELYKLSYPAAKALGYNVRVFNILGTEFENSDGWDCLRMIRDAKDKVTAAQMFANVILSNVSIASGDNFWWQANINCLMLALLYVAASNHFVPADLRESVSENDEKHEEYYEKYRTIDEVYRLITSADEDGKGTMKETVKDAMRVDPDGDGQLLRAPYTNWNTHPQAGAIQAGLGTSLAILSSPEVARILSTDDIDFRELVEEKTIIYIICSDQDSTYKSILTLFISFMFREVVAYADKRPSQTLDRPLYLILEECGNIGRIPDMSKKVSTVRSRNIGIMFCFQTLGQIQDIYGSLQDGRHEYETILAGCSMHLCLGGNDQATCEFFSKRSGTMSTINLRETEHRSKLLPEGLQRATVLNKNKMTSVAPRPTMFPDEIQHITKEQILLSPATRNVTLENKYFYKDHPLFIYRLMDKVTGELITPLTKNYIPRWSDELSMDELYEAVNSGVYRPQGYTEYAESSKAKRGSHYL